MTTFIAEQAFVDPRAEIDHDVEIGPFCIIGPGAKIGRGTHLVGNVTIMGQVSIGRHNHIYPGTVIGGEPQDASYQGSDTQVIIGDHNRIREGVTINRGSEKEDGITRIENHNFLMANSHVAHDCYLGSHIVLANASLLGGHVHIEDHACLSGCACVHHFVTIGRFAFIGGLSRVIHDVPPYMLIDGQPARPRCINVVGLKRNAFSSQSIACISEAHRLIYRTKVGLEEACNRLRSDDQWTPEVAQILDFVQNQQDGEHGRARDGRRAA